MVLQVVLQLMRRLVDRFGGGGRVAAEPCRVGRPRADSLCHVAMQQIRQ